MAGPHTRRKSQTLLSPPGPRTLHAENTPSFSSFFARGKLRACALRWLARCCWLNPGRTGSLVLPPAPLPPTTGGVVTAEEVAEEGTLVCGIRVVCETSVSAMMPKTLQDGVGAWLPLSMFRSWEGAFVYGCWALLRMLPDISCMLGNVFLYINGTRQLSIGKHNNVFFKKTNAVFLTVTIEPAKN